MPLTIDLDDIPDDAPPIRKSVCEMAEGTNANPPVFRGVTLAEDGKCRATYRRNGKQYILGLFDDEVGAARAYAKAVGKYDAQHVPIVSGYVSEKPDDVQRRLDENATATPAGEVQGRIDSAGAPHNVRPIISKNDTNFAGVEKRVKGSRAYPSVNGAITALGIFPTAEQAAVIQARTRYVLSNKKETESIQTSRNDTISTTECCTKSGKDTLSCSQNRNRSCLSHLTKPSSENRRVSFDLGDNGGVPRDVIKLKRATGRKRRKNNYQPYYLETKKPKHTWDRQWDENESAWDGPWIMVVSSVKK